MIHPPPSDYSITPKVVEFPTSRHWWRLTGAENSSSCHFGRDGDYRWDSPTCNYGVLYMGDSADCAFAETFGHDIVMTHSPGQKRLISDVELIERKIYHLSCSKTLLLADFSGAGISALTLDNSINTTSDYALPQQWSEWVHHHPDVQFDGIYYRSRALPSSGAVALFERAAPTITEEDQGLALHWQDKLTGKSMLMIALEQGWTPVFEMG